VGHPESIPDAGPVSCPYPVPDAYAFVHAHGRGAFGNAHSISDSGSHGLAITVACPVSDAQTFSNAASGTYADTQANT
jgi:hypothetical protein